MNRSDNHGHYPSVLTPEKRHEMLKCVVVRQQGTAGTHPMECKNLSDTLSLGVQLGVGNLTCACLIVAARQLVYHAVPLLDGSVCQDLCQSMHATHKNLNYQNRETE
jgi:hypothetical protein